MAIAPISWMGKMLWRYTGMNAACRHFPILNHYLTLTYCLSPYLRKKAKRILKRIVEHLGRWEAWHNKHIKCVPHGAVLHFLFANVFSMPVTLLTPKDLWWHFTVRHVDSKAMLHIIDFYPTHFLTFTSRLLTCPHDGSHIISLASVIRIAYGTCERAPKGCSDMSHQWQ